MKKRFAAILRLVLAICLLAACGGTPADNTPSDKSPANSAEPAPSATDDKNGDAPVDDGKTWELNLGCVANDPANVTEYNANGKAIQVFADKVNEYTNGRVTVNIHWASVLGSNVAMYDEIQMGSLDFHAGQPMSSADPRFACWNLPFMFDTYDEIWAATNRDGGEVFAMSADWMAESDVKLLAFGVGSLRGFVSNTEVHTPADAKNLKIRTYEDALVNKFWGSIGTASIIPGSEIYSALQTKTVDAMEFHATGCYSFKLNEVASYFAPLNWQWTNGTVLSCPMSLWDSFPADIQEAIQKAADDYALYQYQGIVEDEKTVFETLSNSGMTITELSESDIEAWHEAADALVDYYKEYVGADVYDNYVAAVEASKK